MHYLLSPYNYDLTDPGSIPNLFLQHLYLVGITMLISLIIAIPLGLLVARFRRLYLPIITISGLLYTIPGIALIGVLITITHLTARHRHYSTRHLHSASADPQYCRRCQWH